MHASYIDSDVALAHMENMGSVLESLLSISDLEIEVYGNHSEKLKNITAGLNLKSYSIYAGL